MLLFDYLQLLEPEPQRKPPNPKTMNPNFFARNALISHISAKKKFGKICENKSSAIENKGNF
jgi:hypothetical protein